MKCTKKICCSFAFFSIHWINHLLLLILLSLTINNCYQSLSSFVLFGYRIIRAAMCPMNSLIHAANTTKFLSPSHHIYLFGFPHIFYQWFTDTAACYCCGSVALLFNAVFHSICLIIITKILFLFVRRKWQWRRRRMWHKKSAQSIRFLIWSQCQLEFHFHCLPSLIFRLYDCRFVWFVYRVWGENMRCDCV